MTGTVPALVLTLGAYAAAHALWRRCGRHPLANPTLLAIAAVVAALLLLRIPYAGYFADAQPMHLLLGPAVVALAVPLHRHAPLLRGRATALAAALAAGSVAAAALGVGLALVLGATGPALASLAPRSATTAVSMAISAQVGGIPALTAVLTIATGITGAVLGPAVLNALGVRDPVARRFALGTASHGIATARAFQEGEAAGSAAGLAMGLNAVLTALLVPQLLRLLGAWLPGLGGGLP